MTTTKPEPDTTPSLENGTMPYLDEGADFRMLLEKQRTKALRDREDLLIELQRLGVQTDARRQRLAVKEEIIARCDSALGYRPEPPAATPSPMIIEHAGEEANTGATVGEGEAQ